MGKQFDEFAKALATGRSRREALRLLAAGIGSATLATILPGRSLAQGDNRGNSVCAHFCTEMYPPGPERGACIAASAQCPPGACAVQVNTGFVCMTCYSD